MCPDSVLVVDRRAHSFSNAPHRTQRTFNFHTHREHSLTENFVLGSTSLLRGAPTTPRQAEQRQPQSWTHVGVQVKPLVSLTLPPAVCDVAVCLCVSVCLQLLLFRSPGWMIITTRSKETSLLCLRGASLTGEGKKNKSAAARQDCGSPA